jgi:hypothetical protein
MGVHLHHGIICLTGGCTVEDAEVLLNLVRAQAAPRVDVTKMGHPHAAILQVLMAFQPAIVGPAADPFINAWRLASPP